MHRVQQGSAPRVTGICWLSPSLARCSASQHWPAACLALGALPERCPGRAAPPTCPASGVAPPGDGSRAWARLCIAPAGCSTGSSRRPGHGGRRLAAPRGLRPRARWKCQHQGPRSGPAAGQGRGECRAVAEHEGSVHKLGASTEPPLCARSSPLHPAPPATAGKPPPLLRCSLAFPARKLSHAYTHRTNLHYRRWPPARRCGSSFPLTPSPRRSSQMAPTGSTWPGRATLHSPASLWPWSTPMALPRR